MAKKRKPVRWSDGRLPEVEERVAEWGSFSSAVGRSTVETDCPFCGSWVLAYLWSLSGGGKRCGECWALLGTRRALQWKDEIKIKA